MKMILLKYLLCNLLLTISIIDWRTLEIPPALSYGVLGVAVLMRYWGLALEPFMAGMQVVLIIILIVVVRWLHSCQRLGWGDVKLISFLSVALRPEQFGDFMLGIAMGVGITGVVYSWQQKRSGSDTADTVCPCAPAIMFGWLVA